MIIYIISIHYSTMTNNHTFDGAEFKNLILFDVVPIIGCIISFLLYSSPIKTVYDGAIINHSFKGLNPIPYPISLGNAVMWLYYSCYAHNVYIFLSNAPGIIVTSYLTIIAYSIVVHDYLIDLKKNKINLADDVDNKQLSTLAEFLVECWNKLKNSNKFRIELIIGINIIVVLFYIFLTNYVLDLESSKVLLGVTGNVYTIIMYTAPLITMYHVIKTRCSKSIDIRLAIMQTVNASIWFTYGLVIADPLIWIVGIPGVMFGLIQILLTLMFSSEEKLESFHHPSMHILNENISASSSMERLDGAIEI